MRKTELRELYKMMFPDYPDIVTVAQLQKMLGIGRHSAYDLINEGYISGIKIGNAFKIPKVNVINYVMEEGGGRVFVSLDILIPPNHYGYVMPRFSLCLFISLYSI